jgi:hypothetical protein
VFIESSILKAEAMKSDPNQIQLGAHPLQQLRALLQVLLYKPPPARTKVRAMAMFTL